MKGFEYVAPVTVDQAVAALSVPGAVPLAGGTDLIVQLREGRRRATQVVDLKRVPELRAIESVGDGGLRIGAAASAIAIAEHPLVQCEHPALAAAARLIGSLQIQNRASLGGNIANAAPSADGVPPLLCAGARAKLVGARGEREIELEGFFTGPGRTVLEPGELLLGVSLPPRPAHSVASYLRFTPRNEMDIAVVGVGVQIVLDDGVLTAVRIALAAVAPRPLRAREAEIRLVGERPSVALLDEAGRLAARAAQPISDTRGSADYRRELVKVLTARALADCLRQRGVRLEVR